MQGKKTLLTVAAVAAICLGQVYGQATATASISAEIVAPIGLAKTVDMNFGNAAVSTYMGGTIILDPSGTRSTSGGGVTLPATAGTVSAAGFTVSGAPGFTFSISLPASAVMYGPGSASLTVNSFTSFPSSTGTLGSGGTQAITIGASLSVAAAQAPGVYTNAAALPVTVNYN